MRSFLTYTTEQSGDRPGDMIDWDWDAFKEPPKSYSIDAYGRRAPVAPPVRKSLQPESNPSRILRDRAVKRIAKGVGKTLGPVGAAAGGVMTGIDVAQTGNVYGQDEKEYNKAEREGLNVERGVLDPLNTDSFGTKFVDYLSRTADAVGKSVADAYPKLTDAAKNIGAPGGVTDFLKTAATQSAKDLVFPKRRFKLTSDLMDAPIKGLKGQISKPDDTQDTSNFPQVEKDIENIEHEAYSKHIESGGDFDKFKLSDDDRRKKELLAKSIHPDAKLIGGPLTMADRAKLVAIRTGAGTSIPPVENERKGTTRAEIERRQREDEEALGRKIYNDGISRDAEGNPEGWPRGASTKGWTQRPDGRWISTEEDRKRGQRERRYRMQDIKRTLPSGEIKDWWGRWGF